MTINKEEPKAIREDIESGKGNNLQLFPTTFESHHQLIFICDVYLILIIQLLSTIAVVNAVVTFHPFEKLVFSTTFSHEWVLLMVMENIPSIVLIPLVIYIRNHPVNILLLCVFTLSFAFLVGVLLWAVFSTKAIIESSMTVTLVTSFCTLYTFWAAKKGHDFTSLFLLLSSYTLAVVVVFLVRVYHSPLGEETMEIFGYMFTTAFSLYIICNTDLLIKHLSQNNDEYIRASLILYTAVMYLFVSLLFIFGATDVAMIDRF